MKDEPAVIQADFSTFRLVQGRKVCQLIFEIPIEATKEALDALGMPVAGSNIWVAIAKLDLKAAKATRSGAAPTNPPEKPQRKWEDLPYSQQAAIRCGELSFQEFMKAKHFSAGLSEDAAADQVRFLCNAESRKDLDHYQHPGRNQWFELDQEFQAFRTEQKYGQARHG